MAFSSGAHVVLTPAGPCGTMVHSMVIESRCSGTPPTRSETPAERAERVRREAEVIAKAEADIDAGLGIEDDELEEWLDALDRDEGRPAPLAAGPASARPLGPGMALSGWWSLAGTMWLGQADGMTPASATYPGQGLCGLRGGGWSGDRIIPTPADQHGFVGFGHQWKSVCGWMVLASRRRQRSATVAWSASSVAKCGVDHRLVDQRPKMLGRLQLRSVGRRNTRRSPRGRPNVRAMPAGIVEHQDHGASGPRRSAGRRRRAGPRRRPSTGRARYHPSRRWSAGRRRPRAATGSGGGRGRSAAGRPAPRPGAGSASGRGGAGPRPRPRWTARMCRLGLRDGRFDPPLKVACSAGSPPAHAAAAAPGWTSRSAAALPSRAADAPAPSRDAAPSRRPLGPLHTTRPRAASVPARTRRTAHLRSAAWRCDHSAAAGRRAPSGRRRCSAPQFFPPARHEGQHLGDLDEGPPLRQQPDRLVVPRLRGIPCRPVSCFQLLEGQMLDDPRHDAAPEPWSTSLPPPRPPLESAKPPRQSAGGGIRRLHRVLPPPGAVCFGTAQVVLGSSSIGALPAFRPVAAALASWRRASRARSCRRLAGDLHARRLVARLPMNQAGMQRRVAQ